MNAHSSNFTSDDELEILDYDHNQAFYLKSEIENSSTSQKSSKRLAPRILKKRRSEFCGFLNEQFLHTNQVNSTHIPNSEDHLSTKIGKKDFKYLWKKAAKLVKKMKDPWSFINWDAFPVEQVKRYRYNYFQRNWTIDFVDVRMQTESFAHGAMRQCYRLKKLSNFAHDNWTHVSTDFVAKSYFDSVDRKVYEDDVILQSAAKIWGEIFNLMDGITKKVDICQMALIEFIDRKDAPLYHVESFIPGEYVKYNSNSGFVDHSLEHFKNTPQAFSHFTFEFSAHSLMVVDIQGVGEIFTDPQIHTLNQKEFGDGNLGIVGMALFFHTHRCNKICRALHLDEFELSEQEIQTLESDLPYNPHLSMTLPNQSVTNFTDEKFDLSDNSDPSSRSRNSNSLSNKNSHRKGLLQRWISENSELIDNDEITSIDLPENDHLSVAFEKVKRLNLAHSMMLSSSLSPRSVSGSEESNSITPSSNTDEKTSAVREKRTRFISISSPEDDSETCLMFQNVCKNRRSSKSGPTIAYNDKSFGVLGKIHHELAHLHQLGRFVNKTLSSNNNQIDYKAIYFHEKKAAQFNNLEALHTIYCYHLEFSSSNSLLNNINSNKEINALLPDKDVKIGRFFLMRAAELDDFFAIEKLVERVLFLDNDLPLEEAAELLEHLIELRLERDLQENENLNSNFAFSDLKPIYELQAMLGELYNRDDRGFQRDPDKAYKFLNDAAETATSAMKGRLAAKYFEAAEMIEFEE